MISRQRGFRAVHEAGGALGGWARPPPSWATRDSSGPNLLLHGLLLVQNKLRQVSGQLDSVWFSFSAILKKKEKQKLALGSRLIG